jgi:hypothetical protein
MYFVSKLIIYIVTAKIKRKNRYYISTNADKIKRFKKILKLL